MDPNDERDRARDALEVAAERASLAARSVLRSLETWQRARSAGEPSTADSGAGRAWSWSTCRGEADGLG
jgi:hypothetical protein